MIKISAYVAVSGPRFSPAKVSPVCGVRFETSNEPGDISRRGQKLDEGNASFAVDARDEDVNAYHALDALLLILTASSETLRKGGAEQITLFLNVAYQDQCNFELSPEQLQRIVAAGATLAVSCDTTSK